MKYLKEIDNVKAHISSLWLVIIVLSLIAVYAVHGWNNAPKDLRVHIPPDLSTGATISIGEVPKPNIWTFAYYFWREINRWPRDGEKDYPAKLYQYAAYMTPSFRNSLIRNLEKRSVQGELRHRERVMEQLPGTGYTDDRVVIISDDTWVVWLDVSVEESVKGMRVKARNLRYPLMVRRYPVDPAQNPWGIALSGYYEEPSQLAEFEEN